VALHEDLRRVEELIDLPLHARQWKVSCACCRLTSLGYHWTRWSAAAQGRLSAWHEPREVTCSLRAVNWLYHMLCHVNCTSSSA
jgi:hypothetical protein